MTLWEREGRSENPQWTYQERKENLVMQKNAEFDHVPLRSLKKMKATARCTWSSSSVKGALPKYTVFISKYINCLHTQILKCILLKPFF
jgi:hypothetical protein